MTSIDKFTRFRRHAIPPRDSLYCIKYKHKYSLNQGLGMVLYFFCSKAWYYINKAQKYNIYYLVKHPKKPKDSAFDTFSSSLFVFFFWVFKSEIYF